MTIRTLGLEKGGQTYLLRYQVGLEDEVVEEVMRMADDHSLDFDWMDAATMSFQVTHLAAEDCLGEIEQDKLATD